MLARLRSLAAGFVRRRRFEQTMVHELQFHIEARAEDLGRSGVPREEAWRRARVEFGGLETVKDECRQARGLRLVDALYQNLHYATRTTVKAPMLSAAAIVSLALGIGATTALFGFVDAVFLRTLPIEHAETLYYLGHHAGPATSANYPLFERYRESGVFEDVGAYAIGSLRVGTPEGAEPVTGQFVSGNYHALVGVPLAIGRGFSSERDRDPSASPIAVISDGYWTRRFGRSPGAVGSTIDVNGRIVEIVGVTEPGFHGFDSDRRVDITLPISVMALDAPGVLDDHSGWGSLWIIARPKPGETETQALAAADAVFQNFMREPEQQWVRDGPFTDRFRSAALLPAGKGSDGRRERMAMPVRLLVAMAGILLLIACVNVANLLMARAASRGREVALRVSIGASRLRLVGHFLTEGLLLALCGGALGLLVAVWTSGAILSLLDAGPTPFLLDVTLNVRVLAFSIAVSALTGIGFALLPAITATRLDAAPALKAIEPLAPGSQGSRRRHLLVASQMALCVLLLVSAALLGQSLRNLRTFDAGFARKDVVLADVNTMGREFSPERRMALYTALTDRLRQLPGVLSVSSSSRTPIDFSSRLNRIYVPGVDVRDVVGASPNVVTPEYFRTLGIRLVRGRGLDPSDRVDTPHIAVVSERMARLYFGDTDPIGRVFVLGGVKDARMIVGVVEDVRHERLTEEAAPMVYTALAQTPSLVSAERDSEVPTRVTIAVRTDGDARGLAAAIPSELRNIDRSAMVTYVRTMEQQIDAALVRERLLAVLSAAFSAVALVLACVGLYGTLSYHVARRSSEIGIRMALGAARAAVLRQILRESLTTAALGVIAGAIAAFWATGLMLAFLFDLSPRDPATLTAVIVILLATALAAGYLPARRAASVDPASVLKAE